MAIARGTTTYNRYTSAGSWNTAASKTFNHNQNTGDDRLLVISIAMSSGENIQSVTYDGVSMTASTSNSGAIQNFTSGQNRHRSYFLKNPSTGNNNIVITHTSTVNSPVIAVVQSFTGASGIGVVSNSTAAEGGGLIANTHTRTRTGVTAGSLMQLAGFTQSNGQNPNGAISTINGTTVSAYKEGQLNAAYYMVACATNVLPAGSIVVSAKTGANNKKITNYTWEILAASSATPTLTVSTNTVSGFTYVEGNGPSNELTFTVSGDDLTANAQLSAPTNYEISLSSGSGFNNTASIGRTGTDLTSEPRTVYIRLKSSLSVADYNSETLTIASTGATTLNVTLNGTVTAAVAQRRIIIT